jgi:hypothetical protein
MSAAQFILLVAGLYSAIGVTFALVFVTVGVGRIDHATRGAPISFRLIIFPASAALWPVLLRKWMRSSR